MIILPTRRENRRWPMGKWGGREGGTRRMGNGFNKRKGFDKKEETRKERGPMGNWGWREGEKVEDKGWERMGMVGTSGEGERRGEKKVDSKVGRQSKRKR